MPAYPILYPWQFDPLSLFGSGDLGGFWVADDLDLTAGSAVTAWVDRQAGLSMEPPEGNEPVVNNPFGKKFVQFTGASSQVLSASLAISTAALTIIIAAQNDGTADTNDRFLDLGDQPNDAGRIMMAGNGSTNNGLYGYRDPENQQPHIAGGGLKAGGVASYQRSGVASQSAWVDHAGPSVNTETTTTFTSDTLAFGAATDNAADAFTAHLTGKLYGVFIIDRILSPHERHSVERYMQALIAHNHYGR